MGLIERQRIDIQRSQLMFASNQAYLYTQGAVVWASHFLQTNIYPNANGNNSTNSSSANSTPSPTPSPTSSSANQAQNLIKWPVVMPTQNLADGSVVNAVLMDGQSFYNINNLQDENQQASFIQLLKNILPSSYQQNVPTMVSAIIAWLTPQAQGSNVNLEEYYINHQPPYKAAHHIFTTLSELRLVSGVTPQIYNALSQYLIALPEQTSLNVNTAPPILLLSLNATTGANYNAQQAQQLTAQRTQQGGFATLKDFNASPIAQQLGLNSQNNQNTQNNQNNFTTTSNYFLLRADVDTKNIHMTLFALFKRKVDEKNKPSVTMLWQSIGTN